MPTVHPKYIIDDQQRRTAVVLPLEDWNRVLDALEELSDIRAYDKAKAEPQESLPFEEAVREIRADYDA